MKSVDKKPCCGNCKKSVKRISTRGRPVRVLYCVIDPERLGYFGSRVGKYDICDYYERKP